MSRFVQLQLKLIIRISACRENLPAHTCTHISNECKSEEQSQNLYMPKTTTQM